MRIFELIERWAGRVEVTLSGADLDFREARDALNRGEGMRARAAAKRVLERTPQSPVALAVLADACELAGLDAELAMTLEELVERSPSQPALWLRLAQVSRKIGDPASKVEERLTTALGLAEPGSSERKESILALGALAMDQQEPERAELWLSRLPEDDGLVSLRLGDALLAQGRVDEALKILRRKEPEAVDAEHNRALGEALAIKGSQDCYPYLLRAMVLDHPRAASLLSSAIGWVGADEATLAKARAIVSALGQESELRWQVAFARAEGRTQDARKALIAATRGGDKSAAEVLLDLAIHAEDEEALAIATEVLTSEKATQGRALISASSLPIADALASLATIGHPDLNAWSTKLAERVTVAWLASNAISWEALFERIATHARSVNALDEMGKLSSLAAEQVRPVRLAVIGEFNAGKSTFINAWMGAAHAPMGIVPTTATLHHLRYARDPIARLVFHKEECTADRVVALADFRDALASASAGSLDHIELMLPIAALTRVELLDTPGFNALDPAHAEAARRALGQADAVLYLLDANQALRDSDRQVLDLVNNLDLPVQVIVNKADRLDQAGRTRIADLVTSGLADLNVRSLRAPIFVSAKEALAAKLGNADLTQSGWLTIDALIEEEFVGRSLAIKSRAIARATTSIVASLRKRLEDAERQERTVAEHEERERANVLEALRRCESDPATLADSIAKKLAEPYARWTAEAALVFERGPIGPVAWRARAVHASSFLTSALEDAFAKTLGSLRVDPSLVSLIVNGVVQSASAPPANLEILALSAASALTGLLRLHATPRATMSKLSAQSRELLAIAAALQLGRAQPVVGGIV